MSGQIGLLGQTILGQIGLLPITTLDTIWTDGDKGGNSPIQNENGGTAEWRLQVLQ